MSEPYKTKALEVLAMFRSADLPGWVEPYVYHTEDASTLEWDCGLLNVWCDADGVEAICVSPDPIPIATVDDVREAWRHR